MRVWAASVRRWAADSYKELLVFEFPEGRSCVGAGRVLALGYASTGRQKLDAGRVCLLK